MKSLKYLSVAIAYILSASAFAGTYVLRRSECTGAARILNVRTGQPEGESIAVTASIEDTKYIENEDGADSFAEYYSTAFITNPKNPSAEFYAALITAASDTSKDIGAQRDAPGGTAGYDLKSEGEKLRPGVRKLNREGALILEFAGSAGSLRRYKASFIYGRDLTTSTEAYQGLLNCQETFRQDVP